MVHYLQQANYIPALQLNHSLRLNQVVCIKRMYPLDTQKSLTNCCLSLNIFFYIL